ncbi:MAG: regulatory iron-sulfur-containing complex subunit RicT [Dysosmobacter sp.]|nr:regulatory iron-sulfur-containing complex subunit RicT [Dysosmobacter sp.]
MISVRFRGGCKNYDFDPKGLTVKMGEEVVVETAQGLEFATCTVGNHEVEDSAVVQPLCPVLRRATDADRATVERNRRKESEAFDICEKKIADHGLEMKLVNVSCGFDGSKIIFFFTADGRVDFRELVRDLASVFRARIELRQIGVRDEAKMVGGLGICGRPFCCSQFLDSFLPVSIKMAKTQNLSLNPTKISGTCGRLMCCLKYEQNAYEDAQKRMPKNESFVQTPDGPGNVKSVDLLQEKVRVALDSAAPSEPLKTYHNCEICVLRNGKGSREGIEIPAERPERYVPEKKEEQPFGMPFGLTPLTPLEDDGGGWDDIEAPSREKIGDGKRRRSRRRGGRGNAPRPAQEKPGKPAGDKPAKPEAPKDKPPKAEGGQPKSGGNRRGRGRGPRPEGKPQDGAQPRESRPPRPQSQDARPQGGPAPKGEKAEGGEAQRRRRSHHRGGRRRKGGVGGAPSAPTSES